MKLLNAQAISAITKFKRHTITSLVKVISMQFLLDQVDCFAHIKFD